MDEAIKTSSVVVFDNNKILLVKAGERSGHSTGIYGLPAGRLKENESYEDAAIREFNEEAGLFTTSEYLIKLPTFYEAELERKDGLKKFCGYAFYCKKFWGNLKSGDEGTAEWVSLNDLDKLHLQNNVDKMINEALDFSYKNS